MVLKEQYEVSGNWLFRHRSYMPLLVIALAMPAAASAGFVEDRLDHLWEYVCIAVSLLGLFIRAYTVGYAHRGTSGRNTTHQKAEVLNTTGMYSVVRHPLYVGNFVIWLGISMFLKLWWFSLIVALVYWIYYERIIFAEEEFLLKKFGTEFLDWASKTPVFIPNFRNWKPSKRHFALKTVLKREQSGLMGIASTFAFLAVLRDYAMYGRLGIETIWLVFFIACFFVFLALTGLKKAKLI